MFSEWVAQGRGESEQPTDDAQCSGGGAMQLQTIPQIARVEMHNVQQKKMQV